LDKLKVIKLSIPHFSNFRDRLKVNYEYFNKLKSKVFEGNFSPNRFLKMLK